MFRYQSIIHWFVASATIVFLLQGVPFSQRDVATRRLEQEVNQSLDTLKKISASCSELKANDNSPLEQWFIGQLALPETAQDSANRSPCVLKAQENHSTRFYLFAQWTIGFEIFKSGSTSSFLSEQYSTEFPLPLCFLPLILFIIMIPFRASKNSELLYFLIYFLFMSGLNLIQLLKLFPRSLVEIVTTDRMFSGLLLFSLWVSLRNISERTQARTATTKIEALVNNFISNLIGIWNPLLYTLIGPLLFSLGHQIKNLTLFFNSQMIILTLSLFFLGLDFSNIYSFFAIFLTPRYFSFAIIFYLFSTLVPKIPSRQPIIWQIKHFKRYFFVVLFIETVSFLLPESKNIPTLTRIALAFLLVEFSRFKLESWRAISQRWRGPLFALLLSAFTAAFSSKIGVLDLVLAICDPRKHPTTVVPFNLLSGFVISFLTGGLASPFFVLLSEMMQTSPNPIMKAALFDGVLAGLFLSPFSLFNLYPAFQHKIPIHEVLKLRSRQCFIPLFVGLIVYFVGTVTSLRILPPVCFVFCCIGVVTLKLKKSQWKIDTFGLIERNDPHLKKET
ncbi:MAG: hypothetical protein ACKN9V_01015 [Pseudomonadota bacterium]